jgi:hypothetical protein
MELHRTLEIAPRVQRIENGIIPDTPIWNLEADLRTTISEQSVPVLREPLHGSTAGAHGCDRQAVS